MEDLTLDIVRDLHYQEEIPKLIYCYMGVVHEHIGCEDTVFEYLENCIPPWIRELDNCASILAYIDVNWSAKLLSGLNRIYNDGHTFTVKCNSTHATVEFDKVYQGFEEMNLELHNRIHFLGFNVGQTYVLDEDSNKWMAIKGGPDIDFMKDIGLIEEDDGVRRYWDREKH